MTKNHFDEINERLDIIVYVSRDLGDVKKSVILKQIKEIKRVIQLITTK